MTNTATIALTNAHGLFEAPVAILNRAIEATKYRSDTLLRSQAAGHCGYATSGFDSILDGTFTSDLDDCSRLEVLIIWIESGNHTF